MRVNEILWWEKQSIKYKATRKSSMYNWAGRVGGSEFSPFGEQTQILPLLRDGAGR